MVVVMWCLAGGRAVQGGVAEVGPMGALGQRGDGALHGAGVRGWLQARDKDREVHGLGLGERQGCM